MCRVFVFAIILAASASRFCLAYSDDQSKDAVAAEKVGDQDEGSKDAPKDESLGEFGSINLGPFSKSFCLIGHSEYLSALNTKFLVLELQCNIKCNITGKAKTEENEIVFNTSKKQYVAGFFDKDGRIYHTAAVLFDLNPPLLPYHDFVIHNGESVWVLIEEPWRLPGVCPSLLRHRIVIRAVETAKVVGHVKEGIQGYFQLGPFGKRPQSQGIR